MCVCQRWGVEITKRNHLRYFCDMQSHSEIFLKTFSLSPPSIQKRALKRGCFGNCLEKVKCHLGRAHTVKTSFPLFLLEKVDRRMCKRQRCSDLVALGEPWSHRCPGGGAQCVFFPLPGTGCLEKAHSKAGQHPTRCWEQSPPGQGHMALVMWGIVFFKDSNISPLYMSYFREAPGPSWACLLSRG